MLYDSGIISIVSRLAVERDGLVNVEMAAS